jgi:tellurite resistance protein
MKDFRNMTEKELKSVLAITNALADQLERDKQADFGAMETTDESLRDAEREAVAFAERRKAGLSAGSDYGINADEKAEIAEIRANIKDYYKRSRKIVKG